MGALALAQYSQNNESEAKIATLPRKEDRPVIDLITSFPGQPFFGFENSPKKAKRATIFVVYW